MKTPIITLILLSTLLFSCKKDKFSTASGNSSLVYSSSYEYPFEIGPVGFVDRLVFESIDPYKNIMGQIVSTANESTVNGKPVKLSEITVSNIRPSRAVVHIVTEGQFMKDHLANSKIVFRDMMDEKTIATFNSCSTTKITYNLVNEDLTSFFKDISAGSFYIHFDFDSHAVSSPIKVYYEIAFDYDYQMKEYHQK